MGFIAPIQDYVGTLVHPSAQHDALTAARHRAFIAPRLFGGIIALALFPIYLLVRGALSPIEILVFAWLVVPILVAFFLSRTGRYDAAHILSSLSLTALVTAIAIMTGGIESFAALWLVVAPLEAALSASRRIIALAATFSLAAAAMLVLLDSQALLPPSSALPHTALAALGIVSATLYAAGLALAAEMLARTSFDLLYAEEERYRLLARNMTDVITRHAGDGSVLFASPAAESLFGARLAELQGDGLFDRVHVADRPAYLTALGDAAALGADASVEFRVRREAVDDAGHGTVQFVWIEMRCRPLEQVRPKSGGAGRREVVAVLRDVSERKRQQEALAQAHAQAERANAAKGRFLATMSHELRTPLNAIIGFSDMLKKETALMLDLRRRTEYAGLINESGHHLLSVVNEILDMSRIDTDNFELTPEPVSPTRVLAGCCSLLMLRAREAGVTLERIEADGLPDIVADRRALNQILLNLIANAIRFTDRGGKVSVGVRSEAAAIAFVVEDNGVGIHDEDLPRLGEPYFQAGRLRERRHGGTGLGLSIVKGLVRLHGGEMTIHSRIGEGTRVTVRLPLDCERARPGKTVSAAMPFASKHHFPSNASNAPSREGPAALADMPVRKRA